MILVVGHVVFGQSTAKTVPRHDDLKIVRCCVKVYKCKEFVELWVIGIDVLEIVFPVSRIVAAPKSQHQDVLAAERPRQHSSSGILVLEDTTRHIQ